MISRYTREEMGQFETLASDAMMQKFQVDLFVSEVFRGSAGSDEIPYD